MMLTVKTDVLEEQSDPVHNCRFKMHLYDEVYTYHYLYGDKLLKFIGVTVFSSLHPYKPY